MTEENWGSLMPLVGTTQVTRSLLDMLNAKPYSVAREEKELNLQEEPSQCRSVEVSPSMLDSIQLADYVADAEFVTSNNILFSNLLFPELGSNSDESSLKSISVNNSNSIAMEELEDCTKKGIAAVCASHGFDISTTSAMRVLIDVTQQYMDTFCKSLRQILDDEALTGQTGFFDSVDQVLHDMNICGIKELTDFYKENALNHHKRLLDKSMKLKEKVKVLHDHPRVKFPIKVKQELGTSTGWRPIPSVDEQNNAISSTRWKSFIKTEVSSAAQQESTSPGTSSWQKDNLSTANMLTQANASQDYFRAKKQRFGN